METLSGEASGDQLGTKQIATLNYVARAGLLPELSRQTYDALWKAIREAVLNALDAGASEVRLDLSHAQAERYIEVSDNGSGMSFDHFQRNFMSLGGSSKFGDPDLFGRIGIGSLALLQYGERSIIETKRRGDSVMTRACISHPWDLDRLARISDLGSLPAGTIEEIDLGEPSPGQFTRIRVEEVNDEVSKVGRDPSALYDVLDRLRRTLPLPWSSGLLRTQIGLASGPVAEVIESETSRWRSSVVVDSAWESGTLLTHRAFGDDPADGSGWSGKPWPILKTLRVDGSPGPRSIKIAGYLLAQKQASPSWSGVSVRVQNAAVEEQCFFDLTSDPGFRKYVTGEVWITGDVDRSRLINIDRASFNRESEDYRVIQRFMQRAINEFKSRYVQGPQRAKVPVRRSLDEYRSILDAIESIVTYAHRGLSGGPLGPSEPSRSIVGDSAGVESILESLEVTGEINPSLKGRRYEIGTSEDGRGLNVAISAGLAQPVFIVDGTEYRLQIVSGGEFSPSVVVKTRPRRIIINRDHPVFANDFTRNRVAAAVALEVAFIAPDTDGSAASFFEAVHALLPAF